MRQGVHGDLWAHRLLIDACLEQGVPFDWRGPGALLISGSGVRGIIEAVTSSGKARVLGLEGFELDGAIVHPRLDMIFDVGRSPDLDPANVVVAWGDEVWVDVTLEPA